MATEYLDGVRLRPVIRCWTAPSSSTAMESRLPAYTSETRPSGRLVVAVQKEGVHASQFNARQAAATPKF